MARSRQLTLIMSTDLLFQEPLASGEPPRNLDPLAIPRCGDLKIAPGRLVKLGERFDFSSDSPGRLIVRSLGGQSCHPISETAIFPGENWSWTPEKSGMFQAEFIGEEGRLVRSLAVVESGWAVCQITVGAFTAEDYAEIIHASGLPANYYVSPHSSKEFPGFTFEDERWPRYEREFGDEIYPHVMANDIRVLDPALPVADANWDSLKDEEIHERLIILQNWWKKQGFQSLDRIATYTPCNRFIEACRKLGIRAVHSLIPEQNWSDGEWVINHWGMPTCPFWIAKDDFRKPTHRTSEGVVGMTMNHYHVLLPHLTKWGDFVLSPSHFTRWIRAADSGEESLRFKQFLIDSVRGWKSLSGDPFFLTAGFEFGRTFGTANMTSYNESGLKALVALSQTEKLVFATGSDIQLYYQRHHQHHPETAFRQRDNWIGCTVNGKPGQAGDSLVIERKDYKALVREGEILPFFYYDYLEEWRFAVDDEEAPRDFSQEIRSELTVGLKDASLFIQAKRALSRTVPLGLWDCAPAGGPFPVTLMPLLDDQREVCLVEIPSGWSGEIRLDLIPSRSPTRRRDDIWKMQTFGEGESVHTYLHLDAALVSDVLVDVTLGKSMLVDSATKPLGRLEPGTHSLVFGPLNRWYRFLGGKMEDIMPDEAVGTIIQPNVLSSDSSAETADHIKNISALAKTRFAASDHQIYQVFCGAGLALGTRSRATAFDVVESISPEIKSSERADGVIAFGPGKSFWYHPRSLPIRIEGLDPKHRWKVLLHTFDPLALGAKYDLFAGKRNVGRWDVPTATDNPDSFFEITLSPTDLDPEGGVTLRIVASQQKILHWWRDKGFIAAVHAMWILQSQDEDVSAIAPKLRHCDMPSAPLLVQKSDAPSKSSTTLGLSAS